MSRTKEETDKMYGYLDKHKERYFDEITYASPKVVMKKVILRTKIN